MDTQQNERFLMVNLYPRTTGLLMTVWAGPGDHTQAPRIKVDVTHGDRMSLENTAVVGILPEPHLIAGNLPAQDLEAVSAWITLNREPLLAHWQGRIDGAEMAAQARKLASE
jgi:hypothetical protein